MVRHLGRRANHGLQRAPRIQAGLNLGVVPGQRRGGARTARRPVAALDPARRQIEHVHQIPCPRREVVAAFVQDLVAPAFEAIGQRFGLLA